MLTDSHIEKDALKKCEYLICEKIFRSLPDWFGIEESIVDYVDDIQIMETWTAKINGTMLGFITIHQHNQYSAEIQVMAIFKQYQGQGLGLQLVEKAEEVLRKREIEYFQVKTLAPSHPNPNYVKTRGFYEHMGFKPLEQNKLWGVKNPCLIMVKYLRTKKLSSRLESVGG